MCGHEPVGASPTAAGPPLSPARPGGQAPLALETPAHRGHVPRSLSQTSKPAPCGPHRARQAKPQTAHWPLNACGEEPPRALRTRDILVGFPSTEAVVLWGQEGLEREGLGTEGPIRNVVAPLSFWVAFPASMSVSPQPSRQATRTRSPQHGPCRPGGHGGHREVAPATAWLSATGWRRLSVEQEKAHPPAPSVLQSPSSTRSTGGPVTHGPRGPGSPCSLNPTLSLPPSWPVPAVRGGVPVSEAGLGHLLCGRACWDVRWPGPPRLPQASVAPQETAWTPAGVQTQGRTDRKPLG